MKLNFNTITKVKNSKTFFPSILFFIRIHQKFVCITVFSSKRNLLSLLCLLFLPLFTFSQSFNSQFNISHDTNFTFVLNGLLDRNNCQKPHFYIAGGWPDSKRLPVFESIDSIVVTNSGLTDVTKFQIITPSNNVYHIDSIVKSSISPLAQSAQDSIISLYNYVAAKHFYYFVPEIESREFKEVTRHFGVYGYGHCGSIANCATLIANKYNEGNQRLWYIDDGNHGVSEVNLNGKFYYLDADQEMLVKGYDNKELVSFGDVYEDLFLFYRTKSFGNCERYSLAKSGSYASLKYLNNPLHFATPSYLDHPAPCYKNDTIGNYGHELFYKIKSGEKIIISSKQDSNLKVHHYPFNYCTNNVYGTIPTLNNALPAIYNVHSSYDLFATNQNQLDKFLTMNNVNYSFSQHKIQPALSNTLGQFSLKSVSQFPLVDGKIYAKGLLNDAGDSIRIRVSFDNISWQTVYTLTNGNDICTIDLAAFIKTNQTLSKYNIYIACDLFVTSNANETVLTDLKLDLDYQISRFLFPSLSLGNNKIQINSNNINNSNVLCNIFWREYYNNVPPQAPSFPIYPANGSVINKTDVPFRWQQINTDLEGDSIVEWQFQLSEYPDFRNVLANNFDYHSLSTEKNNAYFYTYFDTLNSANTFFNHNAIYYWRVRLRDTRNAWSNWSNTWNFRVRAPMAIENLHFEISKTDSTKLNLRWKRNELDSLTTKYRVLNTNNPTSVYIHETQVSNSVTTSPFLVVTPDSNKVAFRVFAQDNSNNYSPPGSIVTLPEVKYIQLNQNLDLTELSENLQHPFPNYPSLERAYFYLYDSTYFQQVDTKKFLATLKGRTILSICYLRGGDTVFKKQILFHIIDAVKFNYNCANNTAHAGFNFPFSFPYQVNYALNGINSSLVITQPNDSLVFNQGDNLMIHNAIKNTDTFIVGKLLQIEIQNPSVSFQNEQYNCSTGLTEIIITNTGLLPYTLKKISNLTTTLIAITEDSAQLQLSNGIYRIDSIQDSYGCFHVVNEVYSVNNSFLDFSFSNPTYICDSNKTEVNFTLTGNAPWIIYYQENGISKSLITHDSINYLYFPNGVYQFDSVSDSICSKNINQHFSFNYSPISYSSASPQYVCDSNFESINIELTGNPPYDLIYYKNGNVDSLLISTNQETLNFGNGIYFLLSIKDSTLCSKNIWDSYVFNNNLLASTFSNTNYICDSAKTKLSINLEGQAPFTIHYRRNSIEDSISTNQQILDLFLVDGIYQFDSVRDAKCKINLADTLYNITNNPLNLEFEEPKYTCDSTQTTMNISMTGIPPFELFYIYNDSNIIETVNSYHHTIQLPNGNYLFSKIKDARECENQISKLLSIQKTPLSYSFQQPIYNCDLDKFFIPFQVTGNPPFTIFYRYNSVQDSILSNQQNIGLFLANGDYQIDSVNDTKCSLDFLDTIYSISNQPLNITFQAPKYSCDSLVTTLDLSITGILPFELYYTYNDSMIIETINSYDHTLQLANGNYLFLKIKDARGCEEQIIKLLTIQNMPISYSYEVPIYDCDSNIFNMPFTVFGKPPFTIHYRDNVIEKASTFSVNNYNLKLSNGNYIFDSISDANCTKLINDTIQHLYAIPLQVDLEFENYVCDSNKSKVAFSLIGNPPFEIAYKQDGVSKLVVTYDTLFSLLLDDGAYYFTQVSDSLNCAKTINQAYQFNFLPLNIVMNEPEYVCDSNKTSIQFNLEGNGPWEIYYRKNSIPQTLSTSNPAYKYYFENGVYYFDSIRDATCIKILNNLIPFVFDYKPLSSSSIVSNFDCINGDNKVHLQVEGNSPFTLEYFQNGSPKSITQSSKIFDLMLLNDNYYFKELKDSTNCMLSINENLQFDNEIIKYEIGNPSYNCDIYLSQIHFNLSGNLPLNLHYRENGLNKVISTTDTNFIMNLSSGFYQFDSISNSICAKLIDPPIQHNINNKIFGYTIAPSNYNCDSDFVETVIQLQGKTPWNLYYKRVDTFPSIEKIIVTEDSNFKWQVKQGLYLLTKISDSNKCFSAISHVVHNNFNKPSYSRIDSFYNCDSNKIEIKYTLQGNPPWQFKIQNLGTGTYSTLSFSQPNASIFLGNGIYNIESVKDAKCTLPINDSIKNNIPKLISTFENPQVSCDSSKYFLRFVVSSGLPPFIINYSENSINKTYITSNFIDTLLLNNGNYFFNSISDSIGCTLNYNYSFEANYQPSKFNQVTYTYDCLNSTSIVRFDINQTQGLTLNYTVNGGPIQNLTVPTNNHEFSFPNGIYNWLSLTDSSGCTFPVNVTTNINEAPVKLVSDTLHIDCNAKEYFIQLVLQGKSPWKLGYIQQNNYLEKVLTDSVSLVRFEPDTYNFISVTDGNQCQIPVNKLLNLNPFLDSIPNIELKGNRIILSKHSQIIKWYKDNTILQNENSIEIQPYGNGDYFASIEDSAGCIYNTVTIRIDKMDLISISPNPAISKLNVFFNFALQGNWRYTIFDLQGKKILSSETNPYESGIDVSSLAKGIYLISIEYEDKVGMTSKHIQKFTKL